MRSILSALQETYLFNNFNIFFGNFCYLLLRITSHRIMITKRSAPPAIAPIKKLVSCRVLCDDPTSSSTGGILLPTEGRVGDDVVLLHRDEARETWMTLELTEDVVLRFRGVDAVVCNGDCVQVKTGVEDVIRYFVTGDAIMFWKEPENIY